MSGAPRRSLLLQGLLVPVLAVAGLAPPGSVAAAAEVPPIVVTTAADAVAGDGHCSLREALLATAEDRVVDACPAGFGADVVLLPAGSYGQYRAPATLPIDGSVTLRGAGRSVTLLQDPLHITSGAKVRLRDLTLWGGGMLNDGHLDARRVQVRNVVFPRPNPPEQGYAVHNRGSMLLIDTEITDNHNTDECGMPGYPGIGNTGSMRLVRIRVHDNTGPDYPSVDNAAGATLRIEGGQFGPNYGQCLGYEQATPLANSGTLTVDNATLHDAIRVGTGATATIRRSLIRPRSVGQVRNNGTLRISATTIYGVAEPVSNGGLLELHDTQLLHSWGISNGGRLVMERSAVIRNRLWPCGTSGLLNRGEALVRSSTFSGNNTKTMDINECLVQTAAGAIENHGSLTLLWSTIADNVVSENGGDFGTGAGGLTTTGGGTTVMRGTVIARNLAFRGGALPSDCGGPLTSHGFNLVEAPADCAMTGSGDRTGIPSRLGSLLPSLTGAVHVPQPGSPLIDAASPRCPARDARGTKRPLDGDGDGTARCDIGAVEVPANAGS